MNKIEIRIWNNYSFNKTAWIQIDNSNLENIWEYINRLKINKNRINAFYVRLNENGFIYNIAYSIKNYRRFVNDLIKRFKKLEINCNISIIDMDEEKEYRVGIYKPFLPPLHPSLHYKEYDKKFIKYRKILKGSQPKTDPGPKPNTIPINSTSIKEYLDKSIRFWRNKLKIAKTEEDKLIAECDIDTFQSVRVSILGKLLPKE